MDNCFNNIALRQIEQDRMTVITLPENPTAAEKRAYWNYIGDMMHNNPDNMGVYTSAFYGLPATQEAIEYAAGIETHRTDWIVEFVTGKKDVNDDAQWNEYLKTAVSKGAQKVLDSFLKEYNELNKSDVTAIQIAK